MADEIVYTWKGIWNPGGGGWYEFFGGADGLPARDLTATDVAGFTDDQTALLASPTGQRLYAPVRAKSGNTSKADSGGNL